MRKKTQKLTLEQRATQLVERYGPMFVSYLIVGLALGVVAKGIDMYLRSVCGCH